ncbi:hypothetical protein [Synechococcus sp. CBW1004]|uniref:hypothetical protein n=1 Tax=Synechococcus sp. CBW1004 TaxID=1353136 RepID=UPI0018CD2F46|nr:hypothetical protein [Synechococcus sp. CBW1004]QPN62994.1 hypothetical protein H8F25_15395 [Synechococcus sp. CBW1004]
MSISLESPGSSSISRSEFLSSLPRWRRWLAMLNWRPVVDYEIRAIEFERRKTEFERREKEHEQRMKQLQSDTEQIESEIALLENEIVQLDAINSRLARFERLHLSSSSPPPCTDDSSDS